MMWGVHHFNTRNSSMVKEIATADYMDGCDIELNMTFHDIGNTFEGATQAYRDATLLSDTPAKLLVTDIYSSRTKLLALLGKLDKVVINSGSATSDELDLIEVREGCMN